MKTPADHTVRFALADGIILLPGAVNGTEGYFAFDTGAMKTVLNSVRCGVGDDGGGKNAVTFDGAARSSTVASLARAELSFGGLSVERISQPVMDMSYVETPLRNCKADLCFLGSIGADLIGDERFTVDYRARKITFRASRVPDGAAEVPLLSRDPLPVISLTVGRSPLRFVLDTGANHFVIDRAAAPMDALEPVPGSDGVYAVASLAFAGAEYRGDDLVGLVSDLSAMRGALRADGIIGSQLLSQRVCCFDYPNGRLLVV